MSRKELLALIYEAKTNYDCANMHAKDSEHYKYTMYRRMATSILNVLASLDYKIEVKETYNRELDRCLVMYLVITIDEKRVCIMPTHCKEYDFTKEMYQEIKALKKQDIKCFSCEYSTLRLYGEW